MPIKVPNNLPAVEILTKENVFVMTDTRAMTQDIRPLQILILNLMPTKVETETQLTRLLGNSPLQVELELLQTSTHKAKNVSEEHMIAFYKTFDQVRNKYYDGMIITGAPVELLEYEEVDYWNEMKQIMEWSKTHVFSSLYICWAAQAGLYYHFGIPKYPLKQKMFGIFPHRAEVSNCQLLRGFDDIFYVPHSRNTEVRREDIDRIPQLEILTSSDISGVHIVANKNGRQYFITGHSEYDRETIANEYRRDVSKGIDIQIPYNYFPNDDPDNVPVFSWRSTGNLLFSNWINYCVYQKTPYNLDELEIRNWNWETNL